MKAGFRSPSISKSLKARTTGKIKRSMAKSVNPFYGEKGIGFAKDPKKSIKNAAYHRITFGAGDVANAMRPDGCLGAGGASNNSPEKPFWTMFILALVLFVSGCLLLLKTWVGLAVSAAGVALWIVQYLTSGSSRNAPAKVPAGNEPYRPNNNYVESKSNPSMENIVTPSAPAPVILSPTTTIDPKAGLPLPSTVKGTGSPKNIHIPNEINGQSIAYKYDDVGIFVPKDVAVKRDVCYGNAVTFEYEPDNKYDTSAVKAVVGGEFIGYINKGKLQEMIHDFKDSGLPIFSYVSSCDPVKVFISFYRGVKAPDVTKTYKLTSNKSEEMQDAIANCEEGDEVEYTYDDEKEKYIAICGGDVGYFPKSANEILEGNPSAYIAEISEDDDGVYSVEVEIG